MPQMRRIKATAEQAYNIVSFHGKIIFGSFAFLYNTKRVPITCATSEFVAFDSASAASLDETGLLSSTRALISSCAVNASSTVVVTLSVMPFLPT